MRKKRGKNWLDGIIGSSLQLDQRLDTLGVNNKEKVAKNIRRNNTLLLIMAIVIILLALIMAVKDWRVTKRIEKSLDENYSIDKEVAGLRDIYLQGFSKSNDNKIFEKTIKINLGAVKNQKGSKNEDEEKLLKNYQEDRELILLVKEAEKSKDRWLSLPKNLKDGRKIHWVLKTNYNWIFIILLGFLIILFVRGNRFSPIKKIEKNIREDIEKQLPNFTNKLVLLLSTGMVFDRAFREAINKWKELGDRESYFYRQLEEIEDFTTLTNETVTNRLYEFAKKTRVRSLVRIVNLIMDNLSKGDQLVDKLHMESELLWFEQKKSMEEKGRLSETRLMMPLLLMLLILVVITVSPAMLDI